MLKLFGGTKADHPMGDLREARRLLAELPAADARTALEDVTHWIESVRSEQSFKPEYRAQLLLVLDEAAQAPLRKLGRDYLSAARQNKRDEQRLWTTIHEFFRQAALGFGELVEIYGTGAKGAEGLKGQFTLLAVRTLRSLGAQLKWLSVRYGPLQESLWGLILRTYAFTEIKRVSRNKVLVYPGVVGESTPELELLRVLMFSTCSADSLLPLDIELAERLIAHFAPQFTLGAQQQADTTYWVDLVKAVPPARIARAPQPSPALRFFGAGQAAAEIEELAAGVRASGAFPTTLNLGASYAPEVLLHVLDHLTMYWSPKLPERKHARHRVKSRLTIAAGFDAVIDVLQPGASLSFGGEGLESWIVENVSTGGFGALVPQVKGDWMGIGHLLALQPEGGDNWLVGVIRRLSRASPQTATVGIQTLSRSAAPVELHVQIGTTLSLDTEIGVVLDGGTGNGEVDILLRPGVHAPGQSFVLESAVPRQVLMPIGVAERGVDYELIRCRRMVRDAA